MKVNRADLFLMLLNTIRQALPARSYLCGWSAALVLRYSDGLTDDQLAKIADEIDSAIRNGTADRDRWDDGLTAILVTLAERLLGETA